jgi:hypothetical protein
MVCRVWHSVRIVPCIRDLGTWWSRLVSFTARPFYQRIPQDVWTLGKKYLCLYWEITSFFLSWFFRLFPYSVCVFILFFTFRNISYSVSFSFSFSVRFMIYLVRQDSSYSVAMFCAMLLWFRVSVCLRSYDTILTRHAMYA